MLSAQDHCRLVLAAIIPGRRDLLDKALRRLDPAHFPDSTHRNIFVMLQRYADATGAVMTRQGMGDIIRKSDAGKVLLYEEQYDALERQHVEDSQFDWSVDQVRELAAERATQEALVQAQQVLHSGFTDEGGRELVGHKDARLFLQESLAEIERELLMQDSPEGDTRREGTAILADYAQRKEQRVHGRDPGIRIGIPELDARLGGLQPGELDLFVAYAGEGKTTLSVQTAWHCSVVQGRNAVIMTTETLRPQVRRKLIARHSKLPFFELPDGLDTKDLKNGTLPQHLENKLFEVVNDFERNSNYGKLWVTQVPRGATIQSIESQLHRLYRQFPVDLLVIDYLALLRAERKRQSDREELSQIIKDAKIMAATFNDGNGVPCISPWQVSRAAYDEAQKTGYYILKSLADTGEAEKSADIVVSLLGSPENENRYATLKCQVLKNRDGEKGSMFDLDIDYATCLVRERQQSSAMASLLS